MIIIKRTLKTKIGKDWSTLVQNNFEQSDDFQ